MSLTLVSTNTRCESYTAPASFTCHCVGMPPVPLSRAPGLTVAAPPPSPAAPGPPVIVHEECCSENNSVVLSWRADAASFVEGHVLELDDGGGGPFTVSCRHAGASHVTARGAWRAGAVTRPVEVMGGATEGGLGYGKGGGGFCELWGL